MKYQEIEKELNQKTTWYNDSEYDVKFSYFQEAVGTQKMKKVTVTIPAGKTQTLPSHLDSTIRKVDSSTNQIVGGLVPWLKKKGEKELNLHPCLDFHKMKEEEKINQLVSEIRKNKDLEEVKKLLESRAK